MGELIRDLAGIKDCLLSARLGAVCERWHLEERAEPSLLVMARETEEPRLQQAAEATATAHEYFEAARDALHDAEKLIVECEPTPEESTSESEKPAPELD